MSPNALSGKNSKALDELTKNLCAGSRRALPELPCDPETGSKEVPDSTVSEIYATMEKAKGESPDLEDDYVKKKQADCNPLYCQIEGTQAGGTSSFEPLYSLIQPQELYDNIKWDYNDSITVPSASQNVSGSSTLPKETYLANFQYDYPQFRELRRAFSNSLHGYSGCSGTGPVPKVSSEFPVVLRRDALYSILPKTGCGGCNRDTDGHQTRRRFSMGNSDSDYQYAVINKFKDEAPDVVSGSDALLTPFCAPSRSRLTTSGTCGGVSSLTTNRYSDTRPILNHANAEYDADSVGRSAPSYRYLSVREPLESVQRRLQQHASVPRNLSMSDTSIHYYSSITENCYEAVRQTLS
ncbi:unnamed protein product [Soboliphyme baturini]|uniref:Protein aurora borealis n=1 Tax=Soboliphyme baturini TaxID=241478 RepID=A0A183JA34_9BILA|nr:unnamed protein product [Soboliphyme baturini]